MNEEPNFRSQTEAWHSGLSESSEVTLQCYTRARPDPTRQSPQTLSDSRKSPRGSSRTRVVEFSLYRGSMREVLGRARWRCVRSARRVDRTCVWTSHSAPSTNASATPPRTLHTKPSTQPATLDGRPLRRQLSTDIHYTVYTICLQCFDAVGWAAGRAFGL